MVTRAPTRAPTRVLLMAAVMLVLGSACSPSGTDTRPPDSATRANQHPPAASPAQPDTYLARTATGTALDDLELLRESWSGDLDGMIARDVVRALVPMSKTFYFLDGGDQRGLAYDAAQLFEQQLNERLERGHVKVHLLMIPVARDELIDGLLAAEVCDQSETHSSGPESAASTRTARVSCVERARRTYSMKSPGRPALRRASALKCRDFARAAESGKGTHCS